MKITNFGKDCKAATAIEYGLIIALIAIAMMGSLSLLGGGTGGMWTNFSATIIGALNRN
jgi:pilus assembly protein Flp/PilA